MSIISYAQNFEDVMLWRALGQIEHGFYIDIGAQDPIIDSVSLAFHEHGWRGIHVEPIAHYAELLRQQRPGDIVIQAAAGNGPAVLQFFEIPNGGLSTAVSDIAERIHRERNCDVHEITVPCIALSAILELCAESEIHWLKIDVEGFEKQVLSSWGKSAVRPWIVVVESTLPLTQIETHESWEAILIGYGYTPVYFDGLNRYYISDAHPELKNAFRVSPNLFDNFTLNGTASAPFHQLIEARYKKKTSEILAQNEQQKLSADNEIERLTLSLATLDKTHAEHEQKWVQHEQEVAAQLLAIQQQAAQEKTEQARSHSEQERALQHQHAEREQALSQQLQTGQVELLHLEQDRAQREKEHAEQTRRVQQELEILLRIQAQREQEVAVQLLASQQQAEQDSHEHAVQVQTLREQLEEAKTRIEWLRTEWTEREKVFISDAEQARDMAHLQAQERQRELQAAKFIEIQLRNEIDQVTNAQHRLNEQLRIEREAGQKLLREYIAMQEALKAFRISFSWRLTVPIRAVVGWCRITPKQIWRSSNPAEQPTGTPLSYFEQNTSALSTQRLPPNGSLLESSSMNSENSTQATNLTQASQINAASNLKTLLDYQDGQFIECAYLTILRRPPDSTGFNYYLDRLRKGVPKLYILGQLLNSPEARERGSKLSGLQKAVWLHKYAKLPQKIISKLYNPLDMREHVQNTNNFSATNIKLTELEKYNGENFIEKCYLQLLHRQADAIGREHYLNWLCTGVHKAEIIDCIVNGEEGRKVGVKVLGLRRQRLIQKIMQLPIVGVIVSVFVLLVNARSYANAFRRLENQSESKNIADASLNTMSSAIAFMRETQRRLDYVETLVQSVPAKSQDTQVNVRLTELISNIVTSYPPASRESVRALYEIQSRLNRVVVLTKSHHFGQGASDNIVDTEMFQISEKRRISKNNDRTRNK